MRFSLDIEDYEEKHLCNSFVATAVVGAGVLGAGATIYSANKAAGAQEDAANTAAQTAEAQYNTTRSDLLPYNTAGQGALKTLQDNDYYTAPVALTEEATQQTPGYQFNLTQGLKAVQNSAAARGLGASGAALKGASAFATGLADSTYQNQFNNTVTNQTNAYNRLNNIVSTGENAAAQTGTAGTAAANTAANAQIGGGNAAAAGANATGSAITNLANNVGGYAVYKGLYGSPAASSTVGSSGASAFNLGGSAGAIY